MLDARGAGLGALQAASAKARGRGHGAPCLLAARPRPVELAMSSWNLSKSHQQCKVQPATHNTTASPGPAGSWFLHLQKLR